MPATEKRKSQRGEELAPGSLVEIEHTYGTRKTSVYQLVEKNESGLSFLIPGEEGYFLPGTPLRFNIALKDKFKSKHVGIARYYYPVYTEGGKKFYKIGIELRSELRHTPRVKYVLRPPRLVTSRERRFTIDFTHHDHFFHFELLDFSRYSAAFSCDPEELLDLPLSSVLSEVKIQLDGKSVFEGEATVSRIYSDRSGRQRVVVEPKHASIDVEKVNKMELVDTAFEGTSSLIRRHESFLIIDTTFKAMVADLRFFLEDFKEYLDKPLFQTERREPSALLEEIFPPFNEKLDGKIARLDTFVKDLDLKEEDRLLYKQYYQKNLLSFFLTSPYNYRIYFKPKGYPGDFEMIRMVHENLFEGSTLFGKLVNKYSMMMPIARAVRERTDYFKHRIRDEMKRNHSLRVFSVASGPALEYETLLKEDPSLSDNATVTLLDQEIEALQFSMENLFEWRFQAGSALKINFIHENLGNYLRAVARGKVEERYDLIYASGLFDYFDDKTSLFVIGKLLSLLGEGGRLIIANLSLKGHHHKALMEFVTEWHLIYRSKKDMARLTEAASGSMRCQVSEIGAGMVKVLEVWN